MGDRRQVRNYKLAVILLLDVLVASHSAFAQQTHSPTLDEILLRLESNLHRYNTQVPNFFCNEHVVSVVVYGKNHQSTITDSVFRLKRTLNPDLSTTLAESREIQTVNGTSTQEKHIGGPSILSGVFSGGLDTVSLSQKGCMRYTLQPIKPGHSDETYVVQFATLPSSSRPSGCVLKEDGAGRVFIDPATMQVKRMELIVPHHAILPSLFGVWHVSIDYAPVLLGGQTFWMPRTITSRATPSDADDPTVWWFNAGYTNYHKLNVTSHILPFSDSTAPKHDELKRPEMRIEKK